MSEIEKIVLKATVNMGGDKPEPKGKQFYPPFEEKVQRALDLSPQLFSVFYTPPAPPAPSVDLSPGPATPGSNAGGEAGAEGSLSPEEAEAFVQEWLTKRREATDSDLSFRDYVGTHLHTFRKAPAEIQEKAKAKWEKFYPEEECPI